MVESKINTCENHGWLKEPATEAQKATLKKALAIYYIDKQIVPKMNINAKIPIRELLVYLQELEPCWARVEFEQMITSNKCINGLNTFLTRFKKEYMDIDTLMSKIKARRDADLQDNDSSEGGDE